MKEAIEEIKLSLLPMLLSKSQTLNVTLPDQAIWLNADKDRIIQVISNLINNASKYSGKSTDIDLATTIVGTQLSISISDSGIGISEEDQVSLFTPFFRASNSETQRESGSGLGLSIAKAIIDMHQGVISISSEYGIGTSTEIVLPDCREGPTPAYLAASKDAVDSGPPRPRFNLDDDSARIG